MLSGRESRKRRRTGQNGVERFTRQSLIGFSPKLYKIYLSKPSNHNPLEFGIKQIFSNFDTLIITHI